MFRKIILSIGLLAGLTAQAGQDGHGGYVIQCDKKSPPQILELWEATHNYHYHVDLGAKDLSVDAKLDIIFNRWKKFAPATAAIYEKLAKEFFQLHAEMNDDEVVTQQGHVVVGEEVAPDLDVDETRYPGNCSLIPAARNVVLKNPIMRPIYVYRKVAEKLDNDSLAMLIVHEVVYFYGVVKKSEIGVVPTSDKTRLFVATLASREVESMPWTIFSGLSSFIQLNPELVLSQRVVQLAGFSYWVIYEPGTSKIKYYLIHSIRDGIPLNDSKKYFTDAHFAGGYEYRGTDDFGKTILDGEGRLVCAGLKGWRSDGIYEVTYADGKTAKKNSGQYFKFNELEQPIEEKCNPSEYVSGAVQIYTENINDY